MTTGLEFREIPCIKVTIQNAYQFRNAVDMVKDINSGNMIMCFYKDRFVIAESSKNNKKTCMIKCKKKNILMYSFKPLVEEDESYSIHIGTMDFFKSLKIDKREQATFEIYCTVTGNQCVVCFSHFQESCVEKINAKFYKNDTELECDSYSSVYKDTEPNSIVLDKNLLSFFNTYKELKPVEVIFWFYTSNQITMEGVSGNKSIMLDLPLNEDYGELTQASSETEEDRFKINVQYVDIKNLTKISKLGTGNVIRIFMSFDCPILFHTKIGNYAELFYSYS